MGKAGLYNHPDRRNDLIVPVLFESMGDQDSAVREAAAYASRFIQDARLAPVLEALLQDKKGVQEQAVLGLGSNGGQEDVLPVAKLFFATNNGVFRLSCLHALATMSLDRDVDVAGVLRENSAVFGEAKQANVKRVTGRFVKFQELRDLVKRLAAPDATVRRQASAALRERTLQRIEFNADGDETSRAQAIQQWREYLLKDYWRGPTKQKPPQPAPAGTP
jgi:HEAT repeat protein